MTTDVDQDDPKREGGPFVYRCCVCGDIAHFGFDVSLRKGKVGTWYCGPCLPEDRKTNAGGQTSDCVMTSTD